MEGTKVTGLENQDSLTKRMRFMNGHQDQTNPNTDGSRQESWATPRSGKVTDEDAETWQSRKEAGQVATMPLTLQVKQWATPNTLDSLPPKSAKAIHREMTETRAGRSQAANLRDQATGNWKTPTQDDAANVNPKENRFAGRVQQTKQSDAKLNPHWVACLMGYPPLWCEIGQKFTTVSRNSKATATPSSRRARKSLPAQSTTI